jgi:hypothetical protein
MNNNDVYTRLTNAAYFKVAQIEDVRRLVSLIKQSTNRTSILERVQADITHLREVVGIDITRKPAA